MINFADSIIVNSIVLVDIDWGEYATIECYHGSTLVGATSASPQGNNSVQVIGLAHQGIVNKRVLTLNSSGAIAQIDYRATVPAEQTTWGKIKNLYRWEKHLRHSRRSTLSKIRTRPENRWPRMDSGRAGSCGNEPKG